MPKAIKKPAKKVTCKAKRIYKPWQCPLCDHVEKHNHGLRHLESHVDLLKELQKQVISAQKDGATTGESIIPPNSEPIHSLEAALAQTREELLQMTQMHAASQAELKAMPGSSEGAAAAQPQADEE